jgi:hypothetical protein
MNVLNRWGEHWVIDVLQYLLELVSLHHLSSYTIVSLTIHRVKGDEEQYQAGPKFIAFVDIVT